MPNLLAKIVFSHHTISSFDDNHVFAPFRIHGAKSFNNLFEVLLTPRSSEHERFAAYGYMRFKDFHQSSPSEETLTIKLRTKLSMIRSRKKRIFRHERANFFCTRAGWFFINKKPLVERSRRLISFCYPMYASRPPTPVGKEIKRIKTKPFGLAFLIPHKSSNLGVHMIKQIVSDNAIRCQAHVCTEMMKRVASYCLPPAILTTNYQELYLAAMPRPLLMEDSLGFFLICRLLDDYLTHLDLIFYPVPRHRHPLGCLTGRIRIANPGFKARSFSAFSSAIDRSE